MNKMRGQPVLHCIWAVVGSTIANYYHLVFNSLLLVLLVADATCGLSRSPSAITIIIVNCYSHLASYSLLHRSKP